MISKPLESEIDHEVCLDEPCTEEKKNLSKENCQRNILPIRDTLDLVGGKWKLPIIHALTFNGNRPMRFKELQREMDGITARMLSKELKDLEMNELVTRTVHDTAPVTVEYQLTKHGMTLYPVIRSLHQWGAMHRRRILR